MAESINVFRNNSFVNPMQLPFLCEKTQALAIVELDLMAGRQAIRQVVRETKLL